MRINDQKIELMHDEAQALGLRNNRLFRLEDAQYLSKIALLHLHAAVQSDCDQLSRVASQRGDYETALDFVNRTGTQSSVLFDMLHFMGPANWPENQI